MKTAQYKKFQKIIIFFYFKKSKKLEIKILEVKNKNALEDSRAENHKIILLKCDLEKRGGGGCM
jgi:hypothetical protein